MTTSTSQSRITGDMGKHRKLNGIGRSPQHSNLKPAAGIASRKSASRTEYSEDSDGSDAVDLDDGSDQEDSSASEDEESTADDADVLALPDVRTLKGEQHLAGHLMNDDDMHDDSEASAGAEEESSPDADYAGLEEISDDEDFVGDVHGGTLIRSAEQDLIEEFERTEQRRSATVVTEGLNDMFLQDDESLALQMNLNNDDGIMADLPSFNGGGFSSVYGVDMNDDPFLGLSQNDGLYREMYDDAEQALGLWRLPESERSQQNSPETGGHKKRVRFEDVERTVSRSSSLSSSEDADANEAFPDLFAAQDDPAVRQNFALDVDPDDTFQYDLDDTASFYDFDGEEERLALELDEEDSDDDDDMSSMNSEDDGDTTDEETAEDQIARMRQMKKATDKSPKLAPQTPRRAIPALGRSASIGRSATPQSTRAAPALGTFTLDKSRASMSADSSGKQIKVFPPVNPSGKDKAFWDRARVAARSRSSTPRSGAYWSLRSAATENMPERPFTAQSTLGSMFNGNLDILRNNDISGIAAEMFPAMIQRVPTAATSTSMGDESDSEVHDIDMQEFIDIDDSGSNSDDNESTPVVSPGDQTDIFDSFTSLGPTRSDSGTGLLDHLDKNRGLVGSFRRNQNQVKHVSSLASNAAERASTSEYNALQKGRRGAANTPMTPARKKRASQDLSLTGAGIRKAVSSPLAGRRPRSRGGSQSGIFQTLGPSIMN